jgi:tetratricopeptide (TPR) repeat protein
MIVAGLCLSSILAAGCARHRAETTPAETVANAWRAFRLGEFDTAQRQFETAIATAPEADPLHPAALYGLATTCALRTPVGAQDRDRSRAAYRRVPDLAPESDLAAWSLLGLARMRHLVPVGEEPDTPAVRAAYREVIDRFPNHPAADEAFVYLQSTLVATLDPADARRAAEALEAFTAAHPDSGFVSAAYGLLASCRETLKEPEARLNAEVRSLETQESDPSNPKQDNSWPYWKIAVIAEFEVGDFATARRFYRRLVEEYPHDTRRYGAEQALRRMDALEAELTAESTAGAEDFFPGE